MTQHELCPDIIRTQLDFNEFEASLHLERLIFFRQAANQTFTLTRESRKNLFDVGQKRKHECSMNSFVIQSKSADGKIFARG